MVLYEQHVASLLPLSIHQPYNKMMVQKPGTSSVRTYPDVSLTTILFICVHLTIFILHTLCICTRHPGHFKNDIYLFLFFYLQVHFGNWLTSIYWVQWDPRVVDETSSPLGYYVILISLPLLKWKIRASSQFFQRYSRGG